MEWLLLSEFQKFELEPMYFICRLDNISGSPSSWRKCAEARIFRSKFFVQLIKCNIFSLESFFVFGISIVAGTSLPKHWIYQTILLFIKLLVQQCSEKGQLNFIKLVQPNKISINFLCFVNPLEVNNHVPY